MLVRIVNSHQLCTRTVGSYRAGSDGQGYIHERMGFLLLRASFHDDAPEVAMDVKCQHKEIKLENNDANNLS